MILQSWGSEVQKPSHWTEVQVSAGLGPSGGSRGTLTAQPVPALEVPVFLGSRPSLQLRGRQRLPSSTLASVLTSSLCSDLLPPSRRDPCDTTGPSPIIQGKLHLQILHLIICIVLSDNRVPGSGN